MTSKSLRPLPVNISEEDYSIFNENRTNNIIGTKGRVFENVYGVARGIFVWNGSLLDDTFAPNSEPEADVVKKVDRRVRSRRLIAIRKKSVFCFCDNYCDNYYHLLTEAIPRLINNYEYITRDHDVLLTRYLMRRSFIEPVIRAFVDNDISYMTSSRRPYLIKSFYLCGWQAERNSHDPDAIGYAANKLRKFNGINSRSGKRRVYISRSRALTRKLVNEREVLNLIEKYNFEVVHCEDLSVSQQIQLFSECEVVLGVHGAGMTNMMFMAKGAKVLEILPHAKEMRRCYYSLAAAKEHKYAYVFGNLDGKKEEPYDANVIVDIRKLDDALHSLGLNAKI